MAVNTREDFFGVLEKSALLNATRLDEARRLVAGMTEPAAIARKLVQQNLISRWQAQQLLAGRHSLFISKYRLLDLLGHDAVGPIYLAEHTQMDRRVVLKTLARRDGNSSAAVDKFLSETATLATLDHRHLCHIYDVDREGDFYYLVMEHVQGRNLQQVVESDGPMAIEAAAGLICLAADAMGHAHQQGILHLGLRPDRLVVDGQGMVKVLDIGVARLADKESPDGSSIQDANQYVYQAPEQIAGTGQPDARIDVYALGAVLHLLLVGEPLKLNGAQRTANIRERRRDIPAELAQIYQKMTAVKPRDRYPTAKEAAAALETWLQQAETARPAVRAKAPAAKPRGAAAPPAEPANEAVPPALNFNAAPNASGAQATIQRRAADRRKLFLGAGIGVGLVAVIGVIALLMGRSGRTLPSGNPTAATTTGGQALPGAATTGAITTQQHDEEPIIRRLIPVKIIGAPAAKFLTQADGSVLVDGKLPPVTEYQVIAKSDEPSIAGLRLDVLSHTPAAKGRKEKPKPARFRLTEVKIETASDEKFTTPTTLKLAQATADYDEPGMPATKAIDGNRKTHWGADSQADEDHWATFWFAEPLIAKAGGSQPQWFRVTLDQAEKGLRIYEFRLSTVTGKRPEADPDLSPETPLHSSDAMPVLAYWRFEKPATMAVVASTAATPAVEDVSGSKNHLFRPAGGEPARFSPDVANPKVRSTGETNSRCLDDTQPAKTKGATWGLATAAARLPRDLASFKLDTWTIEASFLLDQLGFTHTLLGKDGPPKTGSQAPLQLRVRGDNDRVEIEAIDSTGSPRRVESSAPVVAGRWYHVVAVGDGKQVRLWVDAGDGGGLELQGGAPFTGPLAQGPGEWSVGRGFSEGLPADDALMLIDEVRITAAALDPPQMLMYATPAELAAEKAAPAIRQDNAATPAGGKIKFHPLKVLEVEGPEGVKFEPQDDGSMLVQGLNPDKAVYTIRSHTDLTGIRGFRLEAMSDHRLPGHGPGRHEDANKELAGNFVVTSMTVAGSARQSERRPAIFPWKSAEADFSQDKFAVATMIDKAPASGWAISPAVGKGHYAVLTTERPVGYRGGTWLTFTISQNFGKNFTLGRFRLSAITGDEPGENPADGILAADKFVNPLAKLASRVSLPPLPGEGETATEETTAPISLGQAFSTPKTPVELRLLGGESAVETEGVVFRLEATEKSEDKSRAWTVYLQTPDTVAGAPAAIAEAAMVGSELNLRWTQRGTRLPLANHLRNCVLEVGVGTQRRAIALREPVAISKLDLGFGRGNKGLRAEIPWLPKPDGLMFSVPAAQADIPAYVAAPEDAAVGKVKCEVTFSEPAQPTLLAVIDCSLKKTLQVDVSPYYLPTPDAKRISLVRSKLDRLKQQWVQQLGKAQAMLALEARTEPAKQRKAALAKQAQELEATLKQLTGMLDRADEIEKAGGLSIQIYLEVGDYRVVLAESGAGS